MATGLSPCRVGHRAVHVGRVPRQAEPALGQKGQRAGTEAGPPQPEFALGPPGQLPRVPGLSDDGAPAAPWLPGLCFGSTLLNGCTETVPETQAQAGQRGRRKRREESAGPRAPGSRTRPRD